MWYSFMQRTDCNYIAGNFLFYFFTLLYARRRSTLGKQFRQFDAYETFGSSDPDKETRRLVWDKIFAYGKPTVRLVCISWRTVKLYETQSTVESVFE